MLGLTQNPTIQYVPRNPWINLFQSIVGLAASRETISDESLVRKASGDPGAFSELYQRYVKRVYAYHLVRTGSTAEAQDLTSQTFLAALEGIGGFRNQGAFAAWLMSIARHKIVDHYRRRPVAEDLEAAEIAHNPQPGVEEIVEQKLNLEQVSRALNRLHPDKAEAVSLRIFGQLSAAETGNVMGKSAGAVRNLVYRAIQELRQQLEVFAPDLEEV